MNRSFRARLLATGTVLVVAPLLLACVVGTSGRAATSDDASPSWACPSPTPKSYGPSGPAKDVIRQPRPTIEPYSPIEYDEETVYYEAWEQEYGAQASGPPFPTPTPYAILGTSYVFGQRVHIAPIYATVRASSSVVLGDGTQLYHVMLTWNNPSGADVPIDYGLQVKLRAVNAAGRIVGGDGWTMSTTSLAAAAMTAPTPFIPQGESRVVVPIVAPAGVPQTVELMFSRSGSQAAATQAISANPTANAELRQVSGELLAVQWTNATIAIGPPCADPGAMTEWQHRPGEAWGSEALPVAAPPGASRVVQLALNQVGKPYLWGAEGPESFDCSGLMQWSYAQIGLDLLRTAQQQHDSLQPLPAPELQPGDLVFFSPRGRRDITHVAMFIGDQNGDGTLDIVHAMSKELGIRVTNNIFGAPYYSGTTCELCIAGFGTIR